LEIKPGQKIKRGDFISHLTSLQYQRNDIDFKPGTFRVRGNIIDIYLVTGREILRIEFFGDEIDKVLKTSPKEFEFLSTWRKSQIINEYRLYPAHFWVTPQEKLGIAIENIKLELQDQLKKLRKDYNPPSASSHSLRERAPKKLLEVQRLEQKVNYDLEILRETGYCHEIENYSRHLEFRKPRKTPFTLIDYFPMLDFFPTSGQLSVPRLSLRERLFLV